MIYFLFASSVHELSALLGRHYGFTCWAPVLYTMGLVSQRSSSINSMVKTEFAPWLTPNIRKAMETRDRVKRIATRIPEMRSSYAKQRNRVTKLIRSAFQDQYKEIVENSKGDPKKMWKTVNKVLYKDMQSTVSFLRSTIV